MSIDNALRGDGIPFPGWLEEEIEITAAGLSQPPAYCCTDAPIHRTQVDRYCQSSACTAHHRSCVQQYEPELRKSQGLILRAEALSSGLDIRKVGRRCLLPPHFHYPNNHCRLVTKYLIQQHGYKTMPP